MFVHLELGGIHEEKLKNPEVHIETNHVQGLGKLGVAMMLFEKIISQ